MILLIGENQNPIFMELYRDLLKKYPKEEYCFIEELGRCITPIEREEREKIEKNGKWGMELVKKAKMVYLVRDIEIRRIK